MENKEILWQKVLTEIELTVSKANFTTWFKDTFLLKVEEGVVYIGVPNAFVKDWLGNKYHKPILKSLRDADSGVRGVEYTIVKDESRRKIDEKAKKEQEMHESLPLSDLYINKDDNLNPRYTFETFVIGPFNELAHAAAQAVITKPASYNPLFFYGDTGRGKTHLLQAIGNHIKKENPNKKVFYLASEKFYNEYSQAVQEGKISAFKDKYKKYDLFIMDDIQFLAKKEKTQEELFHLFNDLYENGKQIVFSSDQHPNYIEDLEDRLKSRFVSGMIVDIPAPDYESRTAIIKNKLSQRKFFLKDEAIDYLASAVEGNIREIEGVLNSIVCQTNLKGKDLDINDIKHLIKDTAKPIKNISVKEVVKVVAKFYDIQEGEITNKSRKKEVVKPRQVVMYLLREDFSISYPSIGQKLGGRDHTTVIHSCEKVKNDLKNDASLLQEINQIRAMI
ncbi:MAG: chromosomal replication initiator protein [Patescibacteria group bacterium]|nr:chromosomal replication initiator protein [Patescibacteria group bacterium]